MPKKAYLVKYIAVLKKPIILSIISGILLALSFPRINLWIFAWIALVPMLFAIENKNSIQSFGFGWLAGFVMFIGQIFWLKVFHLSIPIVLSAYLALYFGLFCLLFQLVRGKVPISDLLIIPIIWTAIEYFRSIGFWGFPAGLLGYSQHQNIAFIQIADGVGVFGITFLLALVNAAVFFALKEFSCKKIVPIMVVTMIVAAVFGYGAVKLNITEIKPNFRIGLVQPGIDFRVEKGYNIDNTLAVLSDLTEQAAKHKPDLIIWPETVITESIRNNPVISRKIFEIVAKNKAYLLIGNADVKVVDGKVKHYNSAFLISPNGQVVDQYNKIRPVPLWEVLPLRYYLGFLRNIEGKGAFDSGTEYTVFKLPKGKFSALICFEGIFPDLARQFVKSGAQFLVNLSNDSWSQSESEHFQHASMNVFRAIENQVYYVRVGNSGVTEVIDPYGRIEQALPIYQKGYLVADIKLKGT